MSGSLGNSTSLAFTLALCLAGLGCKPGAEKGKPAADGVASGGAYELKLPAGLEKATPVIPDDNPLTAARIELGRHLYFEKRLSADDTISCASCHDPQRGWTDQSAVSTGIKGQKGGRSAPTVINRVLGADQFWDGRAASLEAQSKGPIENPIEMGLTHPQAVEKIGKIAGYAPLFEAAFGDAKVTIDRIAQAIAGFERTVVSGNSPFDRYQAGDKSAMSEAAARGMALFQGAARCNKCHSGPNFTDELYHNIGVGMQKPEGERDLGREQFTKKPEDRGKFRTPTLRQIAETGPYMHDGSEETLLAVMKYYNDGGFPNPNLDAEMKPLKLTTKQLRDVVAFLEALTGDVTVVEVPEPLK